jgi:hypothetical protein
MELYKLRYNLYDYLIQDKFNYEYTKANITLWTYALYAIFSILAIIIIVDYQRIKLITIFFIFICGIFVYLSILLKEKLNKIETNKYLNDYINHFKLFNGIFIDSYNNNKIPTVFSSNFDYDFNLLDIKNYPTVISDPSLTITSNTSEATYSENLDLSLVLTSNTNGAVVMNIYLQRFGSTDDTPSIVFANISSVNQPKGLIRFVDINYNINSITKTKKYLFIVDPLFSEDNYDAIISDEEKNIYKTIFELLKNDKYSFIGKAFNNYLIDLEKFELYKNSSKKLRLINETLITYFKLKNTALNDNEYAGKLKGVLSSESTNSYLSVFYSTIIMINKEIRFIDKISLNDIFSHNDEYIKNNNILKFIDIYEDSFRILKKYIFIKINNENELHKFISDNYLNEKDKKISNLSDEPNLQIQDVIIDISKSYDSTHITSATKSPNYILIDIETLNSYFNKNRNTNHIHYYSSEIYKKLLIYYNEKLELNLKNFDVLFDDNKKILQKKLKEVINEFLLFYNFTLATLAIILIIILHIFYIEYFKYI